MSNPNCPCANFTCPMRGDCKACRAYHKRMKPYCESPAYMRGFMRFTFGVYRLFAGRGEAGK